jgi:hypothetical protein
MNRSFRTQPFILGLALVLTGCLGGGGGSQSPQPPNPPAVNAPPVANAGSDQVVNPGATVNLNGASSSDSNGTIATYAWTQTSGTAVTITSPATATPSFAAPASAGALSFQLNVTDNGGASHSDTVTVTVNAIPVANAGADQTVSAGAAVSLAGSATDADGSIANYSWAQTAGSAVTLNNANSATATFTAPTASATLAFSFTSTDDRGAAQVDSVTVTVLAVVVPPPNPAPVIARQPNNPLSLEHGSAMMFVAVSGEDLTFEWRRASGAVMKTGPEPFMLRTGLSMLDNGDCYYVVVSNNSGTATSEQGCLTVEEIDWVLDPSDDPENEDDTNYALGFGEALMHIAQTVTGPFTGYVGGTMRVGFPMGYGPPQNCYRGSYEGTIIDGVMVTPASGLPPLGHHTLSESWDDCFIDPDDTNSRGGAYLVEYDFPQTWGVGTLTIHVSDRYFNGTVRANIIAHNVNGSRSDDIEITIADNFSVGDLKTTSEHSIMVDRRYARDGLNVEDVYVDFSSPMAAFDANGGAGTLFAKQGGFFHLHQDFGGGDDGEPDYTSSGVIVVGLSTYVLAALEPSGSPSGWHFGLLPDDDCPEGYICVDPLVP